MDKVNSGDEDYSHQIIEALANLGNYHLSAAAAEKLINFGELALVPLITQLKNLHSQECEFGEDKVGHISFQIAYALEIIGEPSVTPLIGLLDDKNDEVLSWATIALGGIGNSKATPYLTRLLKAANEELRNFAAGALGKIGDESALDALTVVAAEDPDIDVREKAEVAIARIRAKPVA